MEEEEEDTIDWQSLIQNLDHGRGPELLYKYAMLENDSMVSYLLSRGVNPNIPIAVQANQYNRNHYVLISAAKRGYVTIVHSLLKHNAYTEYKQSRLQETALIAASRKDKRAVLELLLQFGADVNARNHNESTALMEAASAGCLGCCELLVQAGADVNAVNNMHFKAISLAVHWGDIGLVRYLLQHGAKFDDIGPNHSSVMSEAVSMGRIELVQWLIDECGADAAAPTSAGATPMILAVQYNNMDVVDLLMSRGADINAIDTYTKYLPLTLATTMGRATVVEALINKGAVVLCKDGNGNTALDVAKSHQFIGSRLILPMLQKEWYLCLLLVICNQTPYKRLPRELQKLVLTYL